jgi:hypothetical protein
MSENRIGIVAALIAFVSRPVLWLVGIGIVLCMWLRPATRSHARALIGRWGGWPGLPASAWRWASEGLSAWPFAVVAAAVLPVVVSVLISWSFAYVPGMLAVALISVMVAPAFNDEIAAMFGVGRTSDSERER